MATKKKPMKKTTAGSYMGAFGSALGSRRKASMDEAVNRMASGKGSKKKVP